MHFGFFLVCSIVRKYYTYYQANSAEEIDFGDDLIISDNEIDFGDNGFQIEVVGDEKGKSK